MGTCLDLSDGPLLSIVAARLGAPSVLCLENAHDKSMLSRALVHASDVSDVVRTAAALVSAEEESEEEGARIDDEMELRVGDMKTVQLQAQVKEHHLLSIVFSFIFSFRQTKGGGVRPSWNLD